jgi:uncharacterized protein involved in exopolysaccharide biosynthesis
MTNEVSAVEASHAHWSRLLWNNRLLIGVILLVSIVVAIIYNLVATPIYEARATILPPDMTVFSQNRLSASMGVSALLGRESSASSVVLAMLKSEKMARDVIEKFGLLQKLGTSSMEKAVREVGRSRRFLVGKENTITVIVQSDDPRLAAEMANFYVSNLDAINAEIQITSSKPIVRSLDLATPPEKQARPKLLLNLEIALVASLMGGITLVFLKETLRSMRGQGESGGLSEPGTKK